jgi:hypothetical protein
MAKGKTAGGKAAANASKTCSGGIYILILESRS